MAKKHSTIFANVQNKQIDDEGEAFNRFKLMTPVEKNHYLKELKIEDTVQKKTNMLRKVLTVQMVGKVRSKQPNIQFQGMDASIALRKINTSARANDLFSIAYHQHNEMERVRGSSSKIILHNIKFSLQTSKPRT